MRPAEGTPRQEPVRPRPTWMSLWTRPYGRFVPSTAWTRALQCGGSVCMPGPLDLPEKGLVIQATQSRPAGRKSPLHGVARRAVGLPDVHLENDANAGALAEWRYGAGRGVQDLVYLTMSTGVGAGVDCGWASLPRPPREQRVRWVTSPSSGRASPVRAVFDGCLEAYVGGSSLVGSVFARTWPPNGARVIALAGARKNLSRPNILLGGGARGGRVGTVKKWSRFNHYLGSWDCAVGLHAGPCNEWSWARLSLPRAKISVWLRSERRWPDESGPIKRS